MLRRAKHVLAPSSHTLTLQWRKCFRRSNGKRHHTVFLDMKGPITIDSLKYGTVNSAFYWQIIWQNPPYLLNYIIVYIYIYIYEERIHLRKKQKHFENLLGKPPKVTHEAITKIISNKLDIKQGQFTQEELDTVLRKIKYRKAAGCNEIPPKLWKTREFCSYTVIPYITKTDGQSDACCLSQRRVTSEKSRTTEV